MTIQNIPAIGLESKLRLPTFSDMESIAAERIRSKERVSFERELSKRLDNHNPITSEVREAVRRYDIRAQVSDSQPLSVEAKAQLFNQISPRKGFSKILSQFGKGRISAEDIPEEIYRGNRLLFDVVGTLGEKGYTFNTEALIHSKPYQLKALMSYAAKKEFTLQVASIRRKA